MAAAERPLLGNQAAAASRLNAAILNNMRDGLITVDRTGTIVTMNPQAERILSIDGASCIGHKFGVVMFQRDDLDRLNDFVIAAVADPDDMHTAEFDLSTRGGIRHLVLKTSALRDLVSNETNGIVAIISDLTEQVAALRNRIEFGYLTILTMLFMSLGDIEGFVTMFFRSHHDERRIWNWIMLVLMIVPAAAILRKFNRSLRDVGITRDNLGRSIREGLLFALLGALMCVALGLIMRAGAGRPLFPLIVGNDHLTLGSLDYIPHSFLQELLARGLLQGSFKRLLDDKAGYSSIFAASIVFGVMHSHYGLAAILVTFVSGLVFGWIYNRHQNLAGVTLVHVALGVTAMSIGVLE